VEAAVLLESAIKILSQLLESAERISASSQNA